MTRTSRTWVNTALYLGTTVISSLLGLGSALLMTHLLAPDQYGRVGVFLSTLCIVAPMLSLAAEGLIAVNRTTLNQVEYEAFRRTAIAIALLAFVVLQTAATLVFWAHVIRDPLLLVVPMFALLRFASTMATTECVAEQRAVMYAALTVLNSIVALALTYLVLSHVTTSAAGRIAALMTAEAVLLGVRYRGRMRMLLQPRIEPRFRRQIVAFGWPSMIALLGGWALNESDKTVVAQTFGLSTAGFYTAAATLAAVMTSFNQALTNALFPGLFAKLANKHRPLPALMWEYGLKFVGLNGAFAIVVLVFFVVTKDALLPAKYASSSTYFFALVIASLAVAVYRPLGLVVEYFQMARARAWAIVGGGTVTLLTSTIGTRYADTPVMAAVGIAAGYLFTSAVLIFSILLRHREAARKSTP